MLSTKPQNFTWFWEQLNRFLDEKKLRQTKQRKIILETMLKMDSHVDVEKLHYQLKRKGQKIGLATIYRTINLLTEAGLVEQKLFNEGKGIFEIVGPDDHHDHLICVNCGFVQEFHDQQIEDLQEAVAAKFGFSLTSHRLNLFGRCLRADHCPQQKA